MSDIRHPALPVLSIQAIRRMPAYLVHLRNLQEINQQNVSAAKVADHFGLSEIQVRKDFAAVSSTPGKPKAGFSIDALIESIELFLGFRNTKDAVLVGVGSLGRALLNYGGFTPYGLNIVAAFDNAPALVGTQINHKWVLSDDKVSETCQRLGVRIGIITVPAQHAQLVCDQLVAGGVRALWNFAPIHLSVPDGVLVQNEDMAVSLALLSKHLEHTFTEANAAQSYDGD